MANRELDSFLCKFKNLQYAGFKALLTLEAENGEAFVTLKASIGCLPPPQEYIPPLYPGYGQRVPPVHRSPAYHRRQERRKAARLAAEDEKTQTEQVCDEVTEEITEVSEVAEKATDVNADKSPEKFGCDICDFQSTWENGLKVHMSRKHSKIEQLDGNADYDLEDDENYEGSKHYWMKGWLGGAFQSFMDANKVLEDCDLPEDVKDIERTKVLEARKTALGNNFMYFPPWDRP